MLLVIDIGTSNFKAALMDYGGVCRGAVSLPLAVYSGPGGSHEANPVQWLRSFEAALSGVGPVASVEALVISGNGPTVVPVTGEPSLSGGGLSLPADTARLWLDRRAEKEAETVSAIMGAYVDPGFFLPKILAVKEREAELYRRTRYFLSTPEFLTYALTGRARTVFPSEGFERWYWDSGALEKAGLDGEKLPPFIFPGEEAGALLPAVARHFGFGKGVKVFAGGPDFFVSILGTGTVKPGSACDRSGTSEGINLCTAEKVSDRRLMAYGHPVRGYWNLSGIISTTGKAAEWTMELLGLGRENFDSFYSLAAEAGSGSGGLLFLPYLGGERAPIWDPRARGVFMGLSLASGRKELARAVAEGICFAVRDVAEVMEELGAPVREFRVSGGPAGSAFLNQLKADVTGRPVLSPARKDAEITGLAVIGAVAMGKYASLAEAAGAMVRIEREYEPHAGRKLIYDERFAAYRELYRTLKGRF
ncbi:MAG: FGGY-family carbohydrate kinase [Treponema sp.]|nr:FGGY-family carbohydrate kinase [Treponema sp.]